MYRFDLNQHYNRPIIASIVVSCGCESQAPLSSEYATRGGSISKHKRWEPSLSVVTECSDGSRESYDK